MDSELVDKIAERCIETYNMLPKTGKPINVEWTVLSCVVKLHNKDELEVVSLGTGSKCIGATKMCPKGLVLNDSHAEVMARRGFVVYLYDSINEALEGKPSIFVTEKDKCKLKDNIEFVFYSSQIPCGDASIIPKTDNEQQFGDVITTRKRNYINETTTIFKDVYRTGAKCLPECQQDPKETGDNYHLLGQVRTKPGRGDRTLSVSCSDKIAKWIHLGIQGSLLDMLLIEPLYIKHFIFGGNTIYSEESLNRALLCRNVADTSSFTISCRPKFYQSSISFPNTQNEICTRPAPGSIVWIKLDNPLLEVAIMGKKLGATKKNKDSINSSLCICKRSLFTKFLTIYRKHDALHHILTDLTNEDMQYDYVKSQSKSYVDKWTLLKDNFFKSWTVKPKMWNFSIL